MDIFTTALGSDGEETPIHWIPGRRIKRDWRREIEGKSAEVWERKGVAVRGKCEPEEGFCLCLSKMGAIVAS